MDSKTLELEGVLNGFFFFFSGGMIDDGIEIHVIDDGMLNPNLLMVKSMQILFSSNMDVTSRNTNCQLQDPLLYDVESGVS